MSILDTIRSSLRSLLGGGNQSESTPSESSHTEGQVSVERETREAADASTESAIKGTDEDGDGESTETDAAADSESADAEVDSGASDTESTTDDDAVAAETDATASTGSLVDEEAGKEPAEVVTEPGDDGGEIEDEEAVGDETDDDETADAVAAETDAAASTGSLVDEEAGKEPAEVASSSPDEEEVEAETVDDEAGDADGDAETADAGSDADGAGEDGADAPEDDRPVETLKGIGPAYGERLENAGIETVGDLAAADVERVAAEIDISEKRVSGWIERAREES